MTDHVKEALSKHDKAETEYDPDWESWIAGEIATFLQTLIDKGPDEAMLKADVGQLYTFNYGLFSAEENRVLKHLVSRLTAIAEEKG